MYSREDMQTHLRWFVHVRRTPIETLMRRSIEASKDRSINGVQERPKEQ